MDNYSLMENHYTLLLVEDDQELASLVQEYLIKKGFKVDVVGDGLSAVTYINNNNPDLVILDIMLPGISGMDVCRQVRPTYQGPILMLTALDEDIDHMLGLEIGADDYVIKPIKPRLLFSRIGALLRRVNNNTSDDKNTALPGQETEHQYGNLCINLKTRVVALSGQNISLTTAEFDLLNLLVNHVGDIVSRDTITQSLRGFDHDGLDRSVDRRISRLRKKLEDDSVNPEIIKTVRGKGYLFCSPNASESGMK